MCNSAKISFSSDWAPKEVVFPFFDRSTRRPTYAAITSVLFVPVGWLFSSVAHQHRLLLLEQESQISKISVREAAGPYSEYWSDTIRLLPLYICSVITWQTDAVAAGERWGLLSWCGPQLSMSDGNKTLILCSYWSESDMSKEHVGEQKDGCKWMQIQSGHACLLSWRASSFYLMGTLLIFYTQSETHLSVTPCFHGHKHTRSQWMHHL